MKPCRLARFLLYMAPPLSCDGGLYPCPLPKNRHLFDSPIFGMLFAKQNPACEPQAQTVDHPPRIILDDIGADKMLTHLYHLIECRSRRCIVYLSNYSRVCVILKNARAWYCYGIASITS